MRSAVEIAQEMLQQEPLPEHNLVWLMVLLADLEDEEEEPQKEAKP